MNKRRRYKAKARRKLAGRVYTVIVNQEQAVAFCALLKRVSAAYERGGVAMTFADVVIPQWRLDEQTAAMEGEGAAATQQSLVQVQRHAVE